MKKGRFSLFVLSLLALAGAFFVILGLLYGNGISDASFNRIIIPVINNLSIRGGKWGALEFGVFLIIEALIILAFRLNKPFSMFLPVYLVPVYFTLQNAYRVYSSLPLSSFFINKGIENTHPGLLYTLFVLELLLGFVVLGLMKTPDAKWRKKREIQLKMLEKEGVIKSRETLENEKLLLREKKKMEKEEKERKRDEKRYLGELEKKEKAENRKAEKEKAREERAYEKKREKEEIRREREEEKKKKKLALDRDREIEKKEREKEKLSNEKNKERKKLEKEARKNQKKEKDEISYDIGPEPEYERGIGNPDTPLSFPQFEEMPSFQTIGHHTYSDEPQVEEKKPTLLESASFMDTLKDEIEREEEPEKEEIDGSTPSRFKGGGMLEAALESYNSIPQDEIKSEGSSRPIIGWNENDVKTEEKAETNTKPQSFAPSSLDKNHPRYKMFENLQNGVRENTTAVKEKEEEKKEDHIAPSNLDPSHPRYRMFQSLQKKVETEDTKSPSTLFDALNNGGLRNEEAQSAVSYTPGRPFIVEEEPEVQIGEKKEEPPVEENTSSFEETKEPEVPDVKTEDTPSFVDNIFEKKEETPLREEKKEEPPVREEDKGDVKEGISQLRVRSVETAEDGHRIFETKSESDMEDDFNLLVGVGDLASNRAGLTAIALRAKTVYTPPDVSLLKDYPKVSQEIDYFTQEQGDVIVKTLADQKVMVELSNIVKGPAVTMYELKLAQGMIISKIKAREDEINYALGGKKVRILAPVPGKQAVGIEVPNEKISIVGFKDMIYAMNEHSEYRNLLVPMILGRTVTGEPIVIDVAKMPHMIIAGTTGSGKSVCINTFINTILFQKSPKDIRLILVDPKVVELTIYNGIPHLLTPVITDAKRALKALDWLVSEMERRYAMLARYGVRNVKGLNEKIVSGEITGVEKIPYIVLIMDEFADIMAVVGKEMDIAISRIAAKARAAGIHMILATQRPSSDVILGTLKSNLPGRIAFAVSSGINSRVILDEQGAENLLGKGDMLLLDPSSMGTKRIQGAFVSDGEVENVTSFVTSHNPRPEFLEESVFESGDDDDDGGEEFFDDDDGEDLYEAAKKIVYERKSASASYLQRRLKIGYNRAARIIEQMEDDGIVGPANGAKPREILKFE